MRKYFMTFKRKKRLRTYLYSLFAGVCVTAMVVFLAVMDPSILKIMNLKIYDWFFQYRGTKPVSGKVAIVAIDEKSIASLGRWPWSRSIMAELVSRLNALQCSIIGFDIIFSEAQKAIDFDTGQFRQELDSIISDPVTRAKVNNVLSESFFKHYSSDSAFADALELGVPCVLGQFFYVSDSEVSHLKRDDEYVSQLNQLENQQLLFVFEAAEPPEQDIFFEPVGVNMNIPELMNAATGAGFFNAVPDLDGAIRSLPLVCRFNDGYYPSLALKIVSEYLGQPIKLDMENWGLKQLRVGSKIIPTDRGGAMYINFAGPSRSFPYYSAVDVLNESVDTEAFEGAIVLIGLTATGLFDLRITPFSAVYPGVEIHANAIENILKEKYVYHPWWIPLGELISIALMGLLLSCILPLLQPMRSFIVSVFMVCCIIGISFYMFAVHSMWFPPFFTVVTAIGTFIGVNLTRFILEERERRFIKSAFSQYLSPQFVSQLVEEPDMLKLGGEEKVLTVLFTDIVGFTSISERFTPSQLIEFLNNYTTEMSDIIMQHGGTIDKYSGDAIMAFFGAPIFFEDHAHAACAAALMMQHSLQKLRDNPHRDPARPDFATRIGINTGKMIVGNTGSQNKFNYTVLGDAVNLASRLEGTNKFYQTSIIIGEQTQAMLDASFITREIDTVKVKGKTQPVRIFELITHAVQVPEQTARFLEMYQKGIDSIHQRNWKDAARLFEQACSLNQNDSASRMHLERCSHYLISPPPDDWDGAYELKSK